jgi:hypothetical protein
MFFFRINKELETELNLSRTAISSLQGEIQVLKQWNEQLLKERYDLQEIIYKKFGLRQNESIENEVTNFQPVRESRNWSDIKRKLEVASRKSEQPKELSEQEKHWKEKMENEKVV